MQEVGVGRGQRSAFCSELVEKSRLEVLWGGVEDRWNDYASENSADTDFPCWDDVTIALGRAIAKGEWSITIEAPDPDPTETARWLGPLRSYFPMIQVQTPDPSGVDEGNRVYVRVGEVMAEEEEARHRNEMPEVKRIVAPVRR